MNILLVNDDGVMAPGINALKNYLYNRGHNIYVVAPESHQSAKSQAITLGDPLRLHKHIIDDFVCYGVTGFPADCVFMGVLEIYKDIKFDLIVSGINNGANVGFDINYSGTVGAAREALSYGIPCIASSLFTHDLQADFTFACEMTELVINKLSENGFRKDCIYNLNVPYVPAEEIKGFAITNMSGVRYFSGIEKHTDPYGKDYYFITGKMNDWDYVSGTDADYLFRNYVNLTPIDIDYTHKEEYNRLQEIFKN